MAATLSATAIVIASCSSDPTARAVGYFPEDAAVDAPAEDATAPGRDASEPPRDAGKSDAAALPVTCAPGATCATSLVTTMNAESFCALLSDGTVACWGQNANGELGRGDDAGTEDNATPARVAGLTDVVAIDHTCAVDKNGATWCWGTGPYLRDPSVVTTTELTPVKLPIPNATKVAMTGTSACAVVDAGVVCWGANANGQVAVPEAGADPLAPFDPQPVAVPTGAPIRDLFIGAAAFVLRDDGTVLSWGANPPLARISSLIPDPYPAVTTLASVSSMDSENDNACVVSEGRAFCWGSPIYTGYDNPPFIPLPQRKYPELVPTPEPVVQIGTTPTIFADYNTGLPEIPQRACACGVSGAVYCWGFNGSGQAGDGTLTYAQGPVEVVGLPAPAAQVRTTPKSTCALLTNGKVYCWGDDFAGQLGGGKREAPSVVPQEVLLP